jgi:S1-C subfamily serine protease
MNEQPITPPPVDAESSPAAPPSPSRSRRRLVVPAVVAALALGAAGAGVGYATASSRQPTAGAADRGTTSEQSMQPSFDRYYGQPYGQSDGQTYGQGSGSTDTTGTASGSQLAGLVRIVSTNSYTGSEGVGTGLVLTSDGEVVTNHHVVEGATSIKVTVMSTGTTYTSHLVGTDASDDVAVLDLDDASGLSTVSTDTDPVSVGDAVTAVGDGNGTVDHLSSATGTVIATDQPVTTQDEGTASSESLQGMIAISSDVVPGYSGGATYDADGEVIGMTTAATSNTQDPDGYAIPIARVLTVAEDLTNGVSNADYDYARPAFLGIGLASGTTVQGVYDGTPAADAGIKAGDSITSVGGVETTTATQLQAAIAQHSPGDDVKVTWTDAGGSTHSATVTLAKGPVE